MRKLYLYISMIICAIVCASCQKDMVSLSAEIEDFRGGNGKVYIEEAGLNENYACWHNGDKIKLNREEHAVIIDDNAHEAKINMVATQKSYTAAYPFDYIGSACHSGQVQLNMPFEQSYSLEQIPGRDIYLQKVKAPMVAFSSKENGGVLKFRNVGSLMAITIKNTLGSDIVVNNIEVESKSGKLLWGNMLVNLTETSMELSAVDGGGTFVRLKNASGSPIIIPHSGDNTKKFYISIPPVVTKFEIRVNYSIGGLDYIYKSKISGTNSIPQNVKVNLTIDFNEEGTTDLIGIEGNGLTAETAYQIGQEQWPKFLDMCKNGRAEGKFFEQVGQIVLSTDFTGIGSSSNPFKGIYNGNNESIIYQSTSKSPNSGVFNYIGDGAILENMVVENNMQGSPSIIVENYLESSNVGAIGGLVNVVKGGVVEIKNCTVKGSIDVSSQSNVGGICGAIMNGSDVTIRNCINKSIMSGKSCWIGGICGGNNSSLTNIESCINESNIYSYDNENVVGGILGKSSSGIEVNKCINSGSLETDGIHTGKMHGGIIGEGVGDITIVNSVNHGNLRSKLCGGLVGMGNNVVVKNCYTDGTFSSATQGGGIAGTINTKLDYNNGYVYTELSKRPVVTFSWLVYSIAQNAEVVCTNVYYSDVSHRKIQGVVGTTTATDAGYKSTTIKADAEPTGADSYIKKLNDATIDNVQVSNNTTWSKWEWSGQAKLYYELHP